MAVLLITAKIPDECESVGHTGHISIMNEEMIIQVPMVGPRWNQHKLNAEMTILDDNAWKRLSSRIVEVE